MPIKRGHGFLTRVILRCDFMMFSVLVYQCSCKNYHKLGDFNKSYSLLQFWRPKSEITVAFQAPPPMGFSRQECWSGLPLPCPGYLPNPGIKSVSPTSPALAGGFFTTELPVSIFQKVCVYVCLCAYLSIFIYVGWFCLFVYSLNHV